jgi:DnaJ family protein A protein 2
MLRDYYRILNVEQNADENTIKKQYRVLSLKHHPDRGGNAELFKEINEAYEILGDSENRKKYDHSLKYGENPFNGPQNMDEFNDLNGIFNMFFGGGGVSFGGGAFGGGGSPEFKVFHTSGGGPAQQFEGIREMFQQMNKPPPIIKNITITLEQSYNGVSVPIEIEKFIIVNNEKQLEKETLYINIPPGIDNGEIIIIQGRGNIISSTIVGDIKIVITVENNTQFTRQGLDLIYKKAITLKEALCGFRFEITHLNSKKLNFDNTTNITIVKPGYIKSIPGLGLNREHNTGNLTIEFTVLFPDSLTEEQIVGLLNIL